MSNPAPGWQKHPDHEVRIEAADGTVEVHRAGRRIARSERALCVRESGYPTVFYLPAEDVDANALVATSTSSYCPFKGTASYWRLTDGDTDVAWSYREPYDECAPLQGYLAFYAGQVDILTP